MKRVLSLILVPVSMVLVSMVVGCSSSRPPVKTSGDVSSGGVYGNDQVAEFLREAESPDSGSMYTIGIGDRLDVLFFANKELSMENLLVRTDGYITLPYVGDVMAAGLTPTKLDSTLSEEFSEVLREPNLSVILREPAEQFVYVFGQVKRASAYPFTSKVSLLQALALGGGFDRGALGTHVLVIRRVGLKKVVGVEVNVAEMMNRRNIQNDIWLKNYDIVYVPRTRLQSTTEFIGILYDILFPPVDIMLRGWTSVIMFEQLQYIRSRE